MSTSEIISTVIAALSLIAAGYAILGPDVRPLLFRPRLSLSTPVFEPESVPWEDGGEVRYCHAFCINVRPNRVAPACRVIVTRMERQAGDAWIPVDRLGEQLLCWTPEKRTPDHMPVVDCQRFDVGRVDRRTMSFIPALRDCPKWVDVHVRPGDRARYFLTVMFEGPGEKPRFVLDVSCSAAAAASFEALCAQTAVAIRPFTAS